MYIKLLVVKIIVKGKTLGEEMNVKLLFIIITMLISGCSVKQKVNDASLNFDLTLVAAKDGELNILNYNDRNFKQIELKKNAINGPSLQGEYNSVLVTDKKLILGGYKNIVTSDISGDELNYHRVGEESNYEGVYGISSKGLGYLNNKVYYLFDYGMNEYLSENWKLCNQQSCIEFNDNSYGAGVFLSIENDTVNVLLHVLDQEDGMATFYGNKKDF